MGGDQDARGSRNGRNLAIVTQALPPLLEDSPLTDMPLYEGEVDGEGTFQMLKAASTLVREFLHDNDNNRNFNEELVAMYASESFSPRRPSRQQSPDSETSESPSTQSSLSRGKSSIFSMRLLDVSPVENRIFQEHTKWSGLLFKSWHVELVFLDQYARLYKNVVYLGYVLIFAIDVLMGIFMYVQDKYYEKECSGEYEELCFEGTRVLSLYVPKPGGTRDYWIFIFPMVLAFVIVGCFMHAVIHRSRRIKKKYWAILFIFVVYCLSILAGSVYILSSNTLDWPGQIMRTAFAVYATYIFFSGTPSFSTFFFLWLLGLLVFVVGFPATLEGVTKEYGKNSQQYVTLVSEFAVSFYWFMVITALFLVGAFRLEIYSRKQFLRGMLMADQQDEIIKQKTKNAKLQKSLLENMLPSFIVDELREQDFNMNSWKQLRSLTHSHLGVSIMFADLVGFTEFSTKVSPRKVMAYLNDLFLVFDSLCDKYDVYKVETVGDQYVAAVGIVSGMMHTEDLGHFGSFGSFGRRWSSAFSSFDGKSGSSRSEKNRSDQTITGASSSNTKQMLDFAMAIIAGARHVKIPMSETSPVLRVGIHTGSCISGIVGTKNLRFCLFGDTMNTAARMEQKSSPECIHVTQDVVDLVPDGDWEKLKKMEVKGKGTMQTYMLRVGNMLDDKDSLGSKTFDVDVDSVLSGKDYFNPLLSQQQISDSSGNTGLTDAETMTRARATISSLRIHENVSPVPKEIYSEHTKWFGLMFKKFHIELAFQDGEARLKKNVVYQGYVLFLLVLLVNLLFGYIFSVLMKFACENAPEGYKSLCLEFGMEDENSPNYSVKYDDIITFSLFRMTPICAGVLLGLTFLGCLSHWLIHRYCKRKAWALVNATGFYIAILICMHVVIMDYTLQPVGPPINQWSFSIAAMTMIQATLFVFFSGAIFTAYLVWFVVAMASYFGFTLNQLLSPEGGNDDREAIASILSNVVYIEFTAALGVYCVLLLCGSYLQAMASRKRFLQRILVMKQQEMIIKEKNANERMQTQLLENIIPPSLVGDLKEVQQQNLLQTLKKVKSLSQRHMGVSVLFADLVGFTAFAAQVDPFKVMVFLNDLFQVFDGMCDEYNVYKIETIGDCYVASVGVVTGELVSSKEVDGKSFSSEANFSGTYVTRTNASTLNARDLVAFAKAMIRGSRDVMKPTLNTPAIMRVGIHTGSCVSGIIGTKNLKFCLLGDAVETAADMEINGTPDYIQASEALADLVPGEKWEKSKVVNVKSGKSILGYLLRVE